MAHDSSRGGDPGMGDEDIGVADYEREGMESARSAVEFDTAGQVDASIYFYNQAAHNLLLAVKAGSKLAGAEEKANAYYNRAEELNTLKYAVKKKVTKSDQQLDLERAEFLLRQAFEEDENDNVDDAVDLYAEATELCLKARILATDSSLQDKLSALAKQALDRAEELKGIDRKVKKDDKPTSEGVGKTGYVIPPLGIQGLSLKPSSSPSRSSKSSQFGKDELAVLKKTSVINQREYVPFMAVDLKERFAFPIPFDDKDGKLSLSLKQRQRFGKWTRLDDYCDDPHMIEKMDCFSLRQTIVSDCSFVASLAISARYEQRFKKKLISNIIFPQDRQGSPIFNPCGKYMVKLNLNGVARKVIIDDYLPMGRHGELLCSFSSDRNELWISLLEKAYMKVMGGYDFPGSNSNIDLHALTGWIPERIAIKPGSADFNKDNVFSRLFDRFHRGDLLCTVATGDLAESVADRAGLVTTHAYAVLDMKSVSGYKLFLIKNPWSHLRWKGNFSEMDSVHWTMDLKKALNYDPKNAEQFDDGVFWIDLDSVCKFFDVFYLNWNPGLFPHTYCFHDVWVAKGPVKDQYTVGENPQYRLEMKASHTPAACWILLTRHITDKDDFAENKEFIAVMVYKSSGKRIYYPYDPPPFIDGTRINSPHYLCKMTVQQPGTSIYTLVITEYEKVTTIFYTLRVYSACEFSLSKIVERYKYEKKVTDGKWTSKTAGGCANNRQTYNTNPIYQVELRGYGDNHLFIDLKGPKQYNVGFDVVTVSSEQSTSSQNYFPKKSSGDFRSGFCYLEIENIPNGVYNIIPCTFSPGQLGPFFLHFKSTCSISVKQLQ